MCFCSASAACLSGFHCAGGSTHHLNDAPPKWSLQNNSKVFPSQPMLTGQSAGTAACCSNSKIRSTSPAHFLLPNNPVPLPAKFRAFTSLFGVADIGVARGLACGGFGFRGL